LSDDVIDFVNAKPHFQVCRLGILNTKLKTVKTTYKNKILIKNLPPTQKCAARGTRPPGFPLLRHWFEHISETIRLSGVLHKYSQATKLEIVFKEWKFLYMYFGTCVRENRHNVLDYDYSEFGEDHIIFRKKSK